MHAVSAPRCREAKAPRQYRTCPDSPERSEDYRTCTIPRRGHPEGAWPSSAAGRPPAAKPMADAPRRMTAAASLDLSQHAGSMLDEVGGGWSGGKPDNAGA
jgi:hypothetical protein